MSENTSRAAWNFAYEKGLVDILIEHKVDARFRGQNGWTSEGWKSVALKFNQQYPLARFSKQQLQEKEKDLKSSYKAIRDARKESGTGWNESMGMITAEPDLWKKCAEKYPKIKKHEKKGFPLFKRCEALYEGSIATGDLCCTSTEPVVEPAHLHLESLQPSVQPSASEGSVRAGASEDVGANPFGASEDGQEVSEAQSAPPDNSKKRKQSQIATTLGAYLGTKSDQNSKIVDALMEKKQREEDYSVEKCVDALDAMEQLTEEEKATALELFTKDINREIFMKTKNHNVRLIWLRRSISKLA